MSELTKDELRARKCVPCAGGIPPLKGDALRTYREALGDGWELVEEHHISRLFKFANYRAALTFVNAVGELAESEGHHPVIELAWGTVKVTYWTHKIDGLSESDFIMAARTDALSR